MLSYGYIPRILEWSNISKECDSGSEKTNLGIRILQHAMQRRDEIVLWGKMREFKQEV